MFKPKRKNNVSPESHYDSSISKSTDRSLRNNEEMVFAETQAKYEAKNTYHCFRYSCGYRAQNCRWLNKFIRMPLWLIILFILLVLLIFLIICIALVILFGVGVFTINNSNTSSNNKILQNTTKCQNPGCFYGQIYNAATCQCQCDEANGFSGIQCQNVNCSIAEDAIECASIGCPKGAEYTCPFLCKLCSSISTTSTKIVSTSITSTSTITTLPSCYLGCWKDNVTSRVLNGLGPYFTNTVGGGSIESCTSYCNSKNFTYAGVQFGSECYCGNFYNTLSKLAETACYMKCTTNSSEICGGSSSNSVYYADTTRCSL